MAWTTPLVWVTGQVVTASQMNTHVKDNLRFLKGLDGAVTIGADLTVDNLITSGNVDGVDVSTHKAGTAKAQHTAGAGNHTHQSSGAEGATIDHGAALTGKGDDDHTQYALRTILTTRGDTIFRNATVWARLAKGTAGQVLTQGANDPVWSTGEITIASGNLTAGAQAAKIFAWRNIAASASVLVIRVIIALTTAATASASIDIGQSATDALSDNLKDSGAIGAGSRMFLDNLDNLGTNGRVAQIVADNEYVTGYEANVGASTDMVGKYYIFYIPV